MSEKRLSVRIAAVGGERLKAMLMEIGRDGEGAFRRVERSTEPLNAGLSTTQVQAGRTAEQFEQLAERAARMAHRLRLAGAETESVMSRIDRVTGVTRGSSRSAEEFEAYGLALDNLRARFVPAFAEAQRHQQQIEAIDHAHRLGAITIDEWVQATLREEAANTKAAASIRARQAAFDNLIDTTLRNRINEVTGVSAGPARSQEDMDALARSLDDMRARANPAYDVIRRYRAEVAQLRAAHVAGAISQDELTMAINRNRTASLDSLAAIRGRTHAIEQQSRASRMGTFRLQQMFFQVNDIGVSLAGGMNPFVVMAQQGTQIAQIYGFGNGGVNGALQDTGKLLRGIVTRFPAVTAAIAASAVVLGGLRAEINRTSEVQVSYGDVALAVWQTVRDAAYRLLEPAITAIADWLGNAWREGVRITKLSLNMIINGLRASTLIMRRVWSAGLDAIALYTQALPVAISSHWTAIQAGFFRMASAIQMRWGELVSDIAGGLSQMPDWMNVSGIASDLSNYGFDQMARASANEGVAVRLEGQRDALLEQAMGMRDAAAGMVTDAITQALGEAAAIMGEDPLGALFQEIRVRAIQNALNRAAEAAEGAGGAAAAAAEAAAEGWARAAEAIHEYANEAMDLAGNLGQGFVNAFQSAENTLDEFVRTGRASIRDFVTGIIADFARIGARRFIFGPLAQALGGFVGGGLGGGGLGKMIASVMHEGGMVGRAGRTREVPAAIFAGAPRFHNGGWAGLRPNEVPIIAEKGERVLSKEQARYGTGDVHVHFNGVRDAASFRQSRAQIAADLGRAVAQARRGM